MKTLTPRTRARRLGAASALITVPAIVFGAMAAAPPHALAHVPAMARTGEGSGGGSPWLMIAVGLLIGIGIGMLIVVRAKRGHPLRGPGNEPGGRGRGDRE